MERDFIITVVDDGNGTEVIHSSRKNLTPYQIAAILIDAAEEYLDMGLVGTRDKEADHSCLENFVRENRLAEFESNNTSEIHYDGYCNVCGRSYLELEIHHLENPQNYREE
jgi:hypothetical protein